MSSQNNWDSIKRHYATYLGQIMAAPCDQWAIDPYMWDMGQNMISMTPIEENFWADCREADLILYPQYPVHGYFIDFANPVAKVGIECDGKAFHLDKKRDALRQAVLEENGWSIYRITGRECNENWDDDGLQPPSGRVLADQIGELHYIKRARRHSNSAGPQHVGDIAVDGIMGLFQQILAGTPSASAGEAA